MVTKTQIDLLHKAFIESDYFEICDSHMNTGSLEIDDNGGLSIYWEVNGDSHQADLNDKTVQDINLDVTKGTVDIHFSDQDISALSIRFMTADTKLVQGLSKEFEAELPSRQVDMSDPEEVLKLQILAVKSIIESSSIIELRDGTFVKAKVISDVGMELDIPESFSFSGVTKDYKEIDFKIDINDIDSIFSAEEGWVGIFAVEPFYIDIKGHPALLADDSVKQNITEKLNEIFMLSQLIDELKSGVSPR